MTASQSASDRTWLPDGSTAAVRAALATVAPALAHGRIEVRPWVDNRAEWHRNSALIDDRWIVKFAWSESAADKLERETQVLLALTAGDRSTVLRRIVAWSSSPVLFIAPFVPGSPLEYDAVARLEGHAKRRLAEDLASVLARLHDPATPNLLGVWAARLPEPRPQADTHELRTRLCPRLDQRRRSLVRAWCDWADQTLASAAERAVLHGDFHGHNLVVDATARVVCVLDLEEASMGDFHYDFRYLPSQEPTLELLVQVVDEYEVRTRRDVSLERVMAWHVRTVLGDALWRIEAGVALPDGGTLTQWVDELDERLCRLGIETAH